MKIFYGLTNKQQIADMAIAVCNALGHGVHRKAAHLLIETSAAETHLGTHRDRTLYGAGASANQVDEGTFDWLKVKFSANAEVRQILLDEFNIDITKVQYNELDYSPLLGLIFARLRYRTVTEAIPADREGRAHYWKKHYNTFAKNAKGSPEEYLERCIAAGVDQLKVEL